MRSKCSVGATVIAIVFFGLVSGLCFVPVAHGGEAPGRHEAPDGEPRIVPIGNTVGAGDGRIHIIPSLSAPSVKNGERLAIQAVVKAMDGVASVTARIEKEGLSGVNQSRSGFQPLSTRQDAASTLQTRAFLPDFSLHKLLNPTVATLTLRGAPMNLGGTNAAGAMGLWQTEWTATGLEEAYYRVHITVTDHAGHAYTDTSLRFSDPIAGNNIPGATNYPDGGMRRMDSCICTYDEGWLRSAVIDAANGYAYFGTSTSPGRVVKVALGAGDDPPTRVGAVTLNTGEDMLYSAVIDAANGYAWFGTHTSPGRVVKVALGAGANPPTRVGAVTLNTGEDMLYSAVIDAANGYAYFGTLTYPGRVVKVALGAGANPPTRVGAITLATGEDALISAVIDTASGYAWYGTRNSPGRVVKVALGTGSSPPTRIGAVALNSGENELCSAVIHAASGYAYFGADTSPGLVVKVALGAGNASPTRVGAAWLGFYERPLEGAVLDADNGYAYFGVNRNPGIVVKVALGAGDNSPTRVGALTLNAGENNYSAVIDAANGYAYFGGGTFAGRVVRVALSQQGFVKGTQFTLPENGAVQSLSIYSHASTGNLRLGLYSADATPSLLWESAAIANTAEGDWLTVPVADGAPSSLNLSAGEYWLSWQVDTMADVPSYALGDCDEGLLVPYQWNSFPATLEASTGTEPTLTTDRWTGYITYDLLAPTPPSDPSATAVGLDTITWTWQDNSSDEDGFKVWADPGAAEPTTLRATTPPDTESWVYDGLTANTEHAMQTAATNAVGDSAKTLLFTAWTGIEPVAGLAFSDVTTSAITVAATNTPSNLSSGASGLLFSNTTSGADSGWQQDTTPWVSSGLTPNTLYSFSGQSRNGAAVVATAFAGVQLTLAAPPAVGDNLYTDQVPGVPYPFGADFEFSNPAGFGLGVHGGVPFRVSAYQYVWDLETTHVFSGSEPVWNGGALTFTPSAAGAYYLHLRSLNEAGVPGDTLDYGPFLVTEPLTAALDLSGPAETGADSVSFTVTFSSETAPSFDASVVSVAGTLTGAVAVSGADPAYTVTVTLADPDADGTVGIVVAGGVVQDAFGNVYVGGASPLYQIWNWRAPWFTVEPAGARAYVGDAHAFSATADCDASSLTYQWKWEDGMKTEHLGPTTQNWELTDVTLTQAGTYWCEASYDGATHATAPATLEVEPPLAITQQPDGGQRQVGDSHGFVVAVSGGYTPLHYQWRKDEAVLPAAPAAATFALTELAESDSGSYDVVVNDDNEDSIASMAAVLVVGHGMPAVNTLLLACLALILALATMLLARAMPRTQSNDG